MPQKARKRKKVAASEDKFQNESLQLAQALTVLTSGNVDQLTTEEKASWLTCIETVSHQCGLSEEELTALVDIIGNQIFSTSVSKRLISCLIPSNYVPEDVVIRAISWMTMRNFPSSLQICLMNWINSIYNGLPKKEALSYLYSILFDFLRSETVCPHVCELLCKVTKKEHVTSYRMKCLLKMESQVGSQPCIVMLIKLYVDYRPDFLCLINMKTKKALKFSNKITEAAIESSPKDNNGSSPSSTQTSSLPSDETDYNNICKEIQNLNENCGVIKLYCSPMRRQLFTSNLSQDLLCAFQIFLQSGLFADGSTPSRMMLPHHSKDEFLKVLSELTSDLQEGFPEILRYVASYLKLWDGHTNRDIIFNLIGHWEICHYEELWDTVLQPVYNLFFSGDVDFMCSTIECLTNLYRHWALFELPRYFEKTGIQSTMSFRYKTMSIFHKEYEIVNPECQIDALSIFIDKLCVTALLCNFENQALIINSALRFYETVLIINAKNRSLLLLVPSPPVMATLIFSRNPLFLTEVCSLVHRYRDAIYAMKEADSKNTFIVSSLSLVNEYIVNLSNILGLSAAFNEKSIFFLNKTPDWIRTSCSEIREAFNIYRHPALLGLALLFRKEQSLNREPPSLLLKANSVRNDYFQHLSSVGFCDIPLFLKTFITFMMQPT